MPSMVSSIRDAYFRTRVLLKELAEDNAELNAFTDRINANPGIPVPNPTSPFWLQNPPFPELVDKQSKTLPKTADIVIIGSGITGASVARLILSECAMMGIKRRVVMVEARQTCSGATGRNGGHMKCSPYEAYSEARELLGSEGARKITSFQTSHLPIIVDLAQQEGWDLAEAREVETLDVFYDEEKWIEGQQMVEVLKLEMPEEGKGTYV